MNYQQYRDDMVTAGRRLYERGLLVGTDGNLSIRLSENEILMSPSGLCKGYMSPEQLPIVDLDGNMISGDMKPARDIRMHLMVYRLRPDARAVVHAHPPITTGFAIAGLPLDKVTSPEVVFALGNIKVTEYATPTTEQVPRVVQKALEESSDCDALLLANHGALTIGNDVMDAFYKMESLEMFLHATMVARVLGNENALTDEQTAEVRLIAAQGRKVPPAF